MPLQAIAEDLGIVASIVESQLTDAFDQLGVSNRGRYCRPARSQKASRRAIRPVLSSRTPGKCDLSSRS